MNRPVPSLPVRLLVIAAALVALSCDRRGNGTRGDAAERMPNIVYILADDLGYGDLSCYNQESAIRTPNIDRLASQGMRFTDAHSPSSVCTPTRYAILTGQYCWRSDLPVGVLQGYGRMFLREGRQTVPALLKSAGYSTAVIGKWHLGLDWVVRGEYTDSLRLLPREFDGVAAVRDLNPDWIDFSRPPERGPWTYGFDYSYILPASLDMPPYCYLENGVIEGDLDGHTVGSDLNTGFTGAFWRPGKMSKGYDFVQVLPAFIQKARGYIRDRAAGDQAFFLYLPLPAPHTPWVPTDEYRGQSGAGTYGDFVQMVDVLVGRVLDELEVTGLAENTLVIFTSDNGAYWPPAMMERYSHRASGGFRGMKADIWEGGHRIPFIARWPQKIPAGAQSDYLTCLTNLFGTCAELTGVNAEPGQGEDSRSILQVLLRQKAEPPGPVVHHSSRGVFALRSGDWKYIEGLGSGGFSAPASEQPEPGGPEGQLYDLLYDPFEAANRFLQEQEIVDSLKNELIKIRRTR
jgi:arylsulfatase A